MKKKYMIAIAAVAVFLCVATAFAVQAGGKDDPLTPTESTASSDVSLTIGEINSAGTIGGITSAGVGSGAASNTDKNTTTSELTSIAPKSSSAPPAPVIDGAGSETSSGYTKATNPALTDPSKKPSYKETPVIDDGKKKSSSSSSSSSKGSSSSSSKSSSSSSKSSSSKPANGTKKDGMIWADGFGWTKDEGGGGEGTVVSGDWGGGDQVGIME
ncbi:hypothetical protein [Faecalispora jeddahensis]|uniref:hypothetical protein n=1 Tax=Faecalispora jeddahensis TaxID=1414721 RepID=UPI001897AE5C|nr:hypothetical protein [Faecalispora jeddahensis]